MLSLDVCEIQNISEPEDDADVQKTELDKKLHGPTDDLNIAVMIKGDGLVTPDKEEILAEWLKSGEPELPGFEPSLGKTYTAPATMESPNGQIMLSLDASEIQNISEPEFAPSLNSACQLMPSRGKTPSNLEQSPVSTNEGQDIIIKSSLEVQMNAGHDTRIDREFGSGNRMITKVGSVCKDVTDAFNQNHIEKQADRQDIEPVLELTIDANSNKIVVRADEDIDEDAVHRLADQEENNSSATLPSSITPINTYSFFSRVSKFKSRVTADSPECQRVRLLSETTQDGSGEDTSSMRAACSPNNKPQKRTVPVAKSEPRKLNRIKSFPTKLELTDASTHMLDSGKLIKPVPAKKMTGINKLVLPMPANAKTQRPKKVSPLKEKWSTKKPDSFIKLSAKISPNTSQDIKGRKIKATTSSKRPVPSFTKMSPVDMPAAGARVEPKHSSSRTAQTTSSDEGSLDTAHLSPSIGQGAVASCGPPTLGTPISVRETVSNHARVGSKERISQSSPSAAFFPPLPSLPFSQPPPIYPPPPPLPNYPLPPNYAPPRPSTDLTYLWKPPFGYYPQDLSVPPPGFLFTHPPPSFRANTNSTSSETFGRGGRLAFGYDRLHDINDARLCRGGVNDRQGYRPDDNGSRRNWRPNHPYDRRGLDYGRGIDRSYEGYWNNNMDSYYDNAGYDYGRLDDGYVWRYNEELYQQGPLPFRSHDHGHCRPEGSRSRRRHRNDVGTRKW